MESELPAKEQLAAQATSGRPITQSEASAIAHAESDMTRRGPIKGGTAATAQSLHDRQQNFYGVAGEVARKPSSEVTKEDAARVQHFEVCFHLFAAVGWRERWQEVLTRGNKKTGARAGTCPGKGLAVGRGAVSCGP